MWIKEEVPKEIMETAKKRISDLFKELKNDSLEKILISAYLQGIRDAVECEERR